MRPSDVLFWCVNVRQRSLGERMLVEQIYVERILVETLPIYEDNDSGTPDSRKIKFIAALNG